MKYGIGKFVSKSISMYDYCARMWFSSFINKQDYWTDDSNDALQFDSVEEAHDYKRNNRLPGKVALIQ